MDSLLVQKYFSKKAIELAFERVQRWPLRMEKDTVGLMAYRNDPESSINYIYELIQSGAYTPTRPFQYYMPKASGTQRTKSVLVIQDAIVYQAIANKIGELNYSKLSENHEFVFGSVLAPEVADGEALLENSDNNFFFFKFWAGLYDKFIGSVIKSIEVDKVKHKLDTDITGFFDSIPHYNLLLSLKDDFNVEPEILDLLGDCFNAWCGTKEGATPGVGIPQGPIPSFFFANCLLHSLDTLIIAKGYKYYRYMDDIKMFGYEEQELQKAIIIIDRYLKTRALSINSKKTSIESIENEDEAILNFKKLITSLDYDASDEKEDKKEDVKVEQQKEEIKKLKDQDFSGLDFGIPSYDVLKNPEEIEAFWKEKIEEVETEIQQVLIKLDGNNYKLNSEDYSDRDVVRLSSIYGQAIAALDIEPSAELLDKWMFSFYKFPWRAKNLWLTLKHYKDDDKLKSHLMNNIAQNHVYEWFRYHEFLLLSMSQSFSDRELRGLFKMINSEESDLVKVSLYKLLVRHTKDSQLQRSIKQQVTNEKNQYLKIKIISFMRNYAGSLSEGEINLLMDI